MRRETIYIPCCGARHASNSTQVCCTVSGAASHIITKKVKLLQCILGSPVFLSIFSYCNEDLINIFNIYEALDKYERKASREGAG